MGETVVLRDVRDFFDRLQAVGALGAPSVCARAGVDELPAASDEGSGWEVEGGGVSLCNPVAYGMCTV